MQQRPEQTGVLFRTGCCQMGRDRFIRCSLHYALLSCRRPCELALYGCTLPELIAGIRRIWLGLSLLGLGSVRGSIASHEPDWVVLISACAEPGNAVLVGVVLMMFLNPVLGQAEHVESVFCQ